MKEKTTIQKFKKVMINMYWGYPQYVYFGTFEKEFGKNEAKRIISRLKNDELIKVDYDIKNKVYYYELTKKGMDFTISIINLEYAKKMKTYANETNFFTQRLFWMTQILLFFGGATIILMVFQMFIQLFK